MTILVTGASGLIGRHVVNQLVESRVETVGLDVRRPDGLDLDKFVIGDVSDFVDVANACTKFKVQRIIHLGALITDSSHQNPLGALRVNVMGTANILEAARQLDIDRVVYASSMAVYGSESLYDGFVNESSPVFPENIYGVTKLTAEVVARHYREYYQVPSVGLRPTYAYGPGRYTGAVGQFNKVVRDVALKGRAEWVRVFKQQTRLFPIHIEDMASCFVLAATGDLLPQPVYNVGGTDGYTEDDMIEAVRACAGDGCVIEEVSPPDEYSLSYPPIDCAPFLRDSGFQLAFSFEEGVKRSIEHYRSLQAQ